MWSKKYLLFGRGHTCSGRAVLYYVLPKNSLSKILAQITVGKWSNYAHEVFYKVLVHMCKIFVYDTPNGAMMVGMFIFFCAEAFVLFLFNELRMAKTAAALDEVDSAAPIGGYAGSNKVGAIEVGESQNMNASTGMKA